MLLIFLLNILFSQQKLTENTANFEYKINSKGVIAFDSINGYMRYPKTSRNNFFYSISHLFTGINAATSDTIYSSNFDKFSDSLDIGKANMLDKDKYFIYESKYFNKVTGKSQIGEYDYPLYKYQSNLPGSYFDDLDERNTSNKSVFIQSNNDLFTIYHQKFDNGNIEYQLRTLNFKNKDYFIIELKLINNLDFDLTECFFSPLIDPDISIENEEFTDATYNSAKVIGENLCFYNSNIYSATAKYCGFKYLQKSYLRNGNYIFNKSEQFQNINYSVFNSDTYYNTQPFYNIFQLNKDSIYLSDVKAMASIGPFNLSKNDTCVFTYAIGFADPVLDELNNEESNMKNLLDLLNEAENFYYNELFNFALDVPIKFQNYNKICFDLINFRFIDYKFPLKSGKYLILIKKGNKFVLEEKIKVE